MVSPLSKTAAVLILLFTTIAAGDELTPFSRAECEISGTRIDAYTIALRDGECADIAIGQRGSDVVVRVADASGAVLTETDDDARANGRERVVIAAKTAAAYTINVSARHPRMPAGRYAIEHVEIRPATGDDRAMFEATLLNTTALRARSSGKMEEARAAGERAVAIAENALGTPDPFVASLLLAFGFEERELGHQALSREILQRALAMCDATLGREHPLTARAIEGIGLSYLNEDDFAKAESAFTESEGILERTLGPEHPRIVDCLIHMSVLHQELEDQQASIAEMERALRIADKYVERDDFKITALINNLGTFYRELGDYERGEPMLRRALHRIEQKFGVEHPYVAVPLQELGIIARERKHYDEALELLWRAEAAREKTLGYFNAQTGAALIVIANVFDAEGEHERALELRRATLQILEATAGPYQHLTLTALSSLTRTYAALGDIACAIENQALLDERFDKAIELNLAVGSERQKLAYAGSLADRTDRTISLNVNDAPGDRRAAEQALLVILQRKGRVLDAMARNLATLRRGLKAGDQKMLDQLRDTTADLAKVALAGPGKTAIAAYRTKLEKLEKEKEALESRISAHSIAFRAQYQPVTLDAVRQAIPLDAALIEFMTYRPFDATEASDTTAYGAPHYVAYVLRRRGRVTFRDLGTASEIDAVIAKWRSALRDPQRKDVDTIARAVDSKVMQPLQPLLSGVSHMLVSPDGQLGLIPFQALVDPRQRHRIERYRISYLTTGRDLLGMKVRRPAGGPAVVVADPLFGEFAQTSASTLYFAPLAGTREEARSIRTLLPRAQILTGTDASKEALERVRAPRILHVATHGFFLENVRTTPNPLLRAGLALSGANLVSRGNNDGVLTALEASTLDLWGTRLVTLSACDSGVGEVKDREGVYGLRRAFTAAGADTVVMSLWPISDYVTRRIMTAFYRGLSGGLGRGEALRQAQLTIMKSKPHPFYWASFIESGNWKALD